MIIVINPLQRVQSLILIILHPFTNKMNGNIILQLERVFEICLFSNDEQQVQSMIHMLLKDFDNVISLKGVSHDLKLQPF